MWDSGRDHGDVVIVTSMIIVFVKLLDDIASKLLFVKYFIRFY